MDGFERHGYEFGIYAAAPLTQPAFDRTIFSNIPDMKLTADGDEPWERDINITDNWLDFVNKRTTDDKKYQPFFGFLFYDGIHGNSLPPKGPTPFKPYWRRVDHLSLDKEFNGAEYFNLYKNAAYNVDIQLKRVFDQLKEKDLLNNTIVIVTSDHGQEFNDNKMNYWGHGSNFTSPQVHVPLIVHWPGKKSGKFSHRTSHSDISVTLMQDLFNTKQDKANYSLGYHLNTVDRENWTIAGSYVNYAVIEKDRHIVTYQSGQYEILDQTGRPATNQKLSAELSLKVIDALSQFYKH
jgi:membrane-anchored protein YejM (alkaline phosphatase superfamily)